MLSNSKWSVSTDDRNSIFLLCKWLMTRVLNYNEEKWFWYQVKGGVALTSFVFGKHVQSFMTRLVIAPFFLSCETSGSELHAFLAVVRDSAVQVAGLES